MIILPFEIKQQNYKQKQLFKVVLNIRVFDKMRTLLRDYRCVSVCIKMNGVLLYIKVKYLSKISKGSFFSNKCTFLDKARKIFDFSKLLILYRESFVVFVFV